MCVTYIYIYIYVGISNVSGYHYESCKNCCRANEKEKKKIQLVIRLQMIELVRALCRTGQRTRLKFSHGNVHTVRQLPYDIHISILNTITISPTSPDVDKINVWRKFVGKDKYLILYVFQKYSTRFWRFIEKMMVVTTKYHQVGIARSVRFRFIRYATSSNHGA